MGIFATRARPTTARPAALPPRFEAVGEALASGSGSVDACVVVGRDLARDGVSLEETLDGLCATYLLVRGGDPDYAAVRAVSVAWSEWTLGYLHQLSCEDPLTGLASIAHVRSRLSELYRGERTGSAGPQRTHALVVVDLAQPGDDGHRGAPPGGRADVLTHALRAGRLGETARTVFAGAETIGRFGLGRVVVLAGRDERLGRRVALLRRLLAGFDDRGGVRVWIEGLPDSDRSAASLLDELTRL